MFYVILGPIVLIQFVKMKNNCTLSHMWGCAENNDKKQDKVNSF